MVTYLFLATSLRYLTDPMLRLNIDKPVVAFKLETWFLKKFRS